MQTPSDQLSTIIRQYLREHPEVRGLRGLAILTGLSYDSIQKYARGVNNPPKDKLARLLQTLQPTVSNDQENLFTDRLPDRSKFVETDQHHSTDHTSLHDVEHVAEPGGPVSGNDDWTREEHRQETFLPIHDFVWFYPEEMEVIDHPAFQRLGGMHQLGLAHLVYRGATHRRIEHALGTVSVAQRIIEAVKHNSKKLTNVAPDPKDKWVLGKSLSPTEERFIRLAALLHDIGHLPFGHTFEDELRLLPRHDGEKRIRRIFTETRWFDVGDGPIESLAVRIKRLYSKYLRGTPIESLDPSEVVQRIIVHRDDHKEDKVPLPDPAGLRLDICRDIVGNTICADILDYLHRDWFHIGKPKAFDERILQYMEIRTPKTNASIVNNQPPNPTNEDAFVISIGNRPKLRTDGISGILELLESRYALAEAVIFHRTKMVATAMLERAVSLGHHLLQDNDLEQWLLQNPEEVLLPALLKTSTEKDASALERARQANRLASRLMRRDLYHVLLMVTYDELETRDSDNIQAVYGDSPESPGNRARALELLEKDFGLPAGTIVMYCPESRMNKKIAEVRLFVEGTVEHFEKYEQVHDDALSAGHLAAQLQRFKRLWKIGFFIDPNVETQKGRDFIRHLKEAVRLLVLALHPRDESIPSLTPKLARDLVGIRSYHKCGCAVKDKPDALEVAQRDSTS